MNNLESVLAVLGLAREGELVLGLFTSDPSNGSAEAGVQWAITATHLSIRDLVDAEPFVGGADQAGQVPLDVLDVVELGGERVVDVNDNDFPVGFTFVEQGHDAEDLDLLDLTGETNGFTNLAHVQRVVVTVGFRFRVSGRRVFPSLRECSVVPEVTFVREAVANITEFALLGVLQDRVEVFFLGNFLSMELSKSIDDVSECAPVRDQSVLRGPIACLRAWRWTSEGSRQSC